MAGGTHRSVAVAVMRRNVHNALTNPALLLPAMIFPLVFLVAFAGGLSDVGNVPGFNFPSGYTAFQFAFVILQASAFTGIFTGFAVAADFESGFSQRLLLAAPHRLGIILGYVGASLCRFAITGAVLTIAALLAGMQVDGSGVDLIGMAGLAFLVNAVGTLWATGIALRAKTVQAGPAMQIPVFLVLFMAPVYVPRQLLQGWIEAVAAYNPATALLEAGRGQISGHPVSIALGYGCAVGLVAVMALWVATGMRRVERGG